ncbi:MAG: hypothetical protein LBL19_08380 [Spirochaetaceae bacterium]|jgi:hypothetical protein|nr:hypothetical protein [Spirochaetaceae bacterium]
MKNFFGIVLLVFSLGALGAAELTVPRLEMASRGRMEDGEFALGSVVSADLALSGGYKYGALLGFSFEAPDLAKAMAYRNFSFGRLPPGTPITDFEYNELVDQTNDRLKNQGTLSFRVAKATARDLFDKPLELSFFIGETGYFCNGDEFTERFGINPIGSEFRGFFYFPDGIGGDMTRQYKGIHGVRGTGISLALTGWESFVPMLYFYQDFSYFRVVNNQVVGTRYSGDFRFLINRESVKLEAFGGVSLNGGLDANIRGGILAHFSSQERVEFLLQGGIPGWEKGEDFGIDNFYFLMEPRLLFEDFGFYVTFFYHPLEYMHIKTPEERGKADINIKFLSEDANTGFTWGLETTLGLKLDGKEDFSVWVSPFTGFMASGLRWDTKLRVNVLEWQTPAEMFELFIGVRTAF